MSKHFLLTSILLVTLTSMIGCISEPKVEQQEVQLPKVSVQLWSVKNTIAEDFKGTLREISEMGFEGVEFAGNFGPFGNDPQGLKDFLDELGLEASGAHVNYDVMSKDKINDTLSFYEIIGAKLLIVPWDERAWNANKVDEMIRQLKDIQQEAEARGFIFGYHNHDQEFNAYKSETFWDYIAQQTDNNFLLQLDVGWVNFAGKNAVEYVKKYPNRTITTHYKVRTREGENKSVILGQDGFDWASLIRTNMAHGGTQWLVVEQEEYPEGLSELESVAQSKRGLDKIIASL